MDLADLIARVEAAQGPDRELDARIHAAISWPVDCVFVFAASATYEVHRGDARAIDRAPSAYTASLDAAVSLVPEGWRILEIGEWDAEAIRKRGPWQAIIAPAGWSRPGAGTGNDARCKHAATPALALCAAALRARAEARG